ncbi:hypothetical protein [Oceanobacillus saliphilus]|uniref:hypothetical protein n=1 Tax=Oceanobacillus saliphilus TaxID=2925834 RepID=UPI00201DCED8|nr:hypothetical protein [Oceanobacillus saliphilus]
MMFPDRPRQPMHQQYPPRKPDIITTIQDRVGKVDIDQVFETVHQIEKIYFGIRPYVRKFMKK